MSHRFSSALLCLICFLCCCAPFVHCQIAFNAHAGDLIVWNARAIHKIDGPASKDWGSRKRRVLGGTGVKAGARYWGEKRALFSDMSTHDLKDGDPLVRERDQDAKWIKGQRDVPRECVYELGWEHELHRMRRLTQPSSLLFPCCCAPIYYFLFLSFFLIVRLGRSGLAFTRRQ